MYKPLVLGYNAHLKDYTILASYCIIICPTIKYCHSNQLATRPVSFYTNYQEPCIGHHSNDSVQYIDWSNNKSDCMYILHHMPWAVLLEQSLYWESTSLWSWMHQYIRIDQLACQKPTSYMHTTPLITTVAWTGNLILIYLIIQKHLKGVAIWLLT